MAKDAEALQWAGGAGRSDGVAGLINHGCQTSGACTTGRCIGIAIVDAGKEPEDPLSRQGGQHYGIHVFFLALIVSIIEGEEERLVLNDRTADTLCSLMPVVPDGAG